MNVAVLDHTALLALGAGHHRLSRMVALAHREIDRHLYTPALCLAAAIGERPGLGDHIGALPAIDVIELGFAAASTVGVLVADDVDWRLAHAVEAGRPSLDWPRGRPVVTATPDHYTPWGVDTIAVRR